MILDIILIVIIAAFVLIGYKRGLIRTVYNLLAFVASIFLTRLLYPYVSKALYDFTGIYESIKSGVAGNIGDKVQDAGEGTIKTLGLPDFMNNALENNFTGFKGEVTDYLSGSLAGIALNIIALLLVFVLIFVGIRVIGKVLDIVAKLPVINLFNKTAGAAAGALQGVLVVWLILAGIFLYSTLNKSPEYDIVNGAFANFMQNNNLILKIGLSIFS